MRHFLVILVAILATTSVNAAIEGSYFAVIVNDLDTSQEWYETVLGLSPESTLSEDDRYKIVNLKGRGLFVELLELATAQDRPEGLVRGPFKVGMLVRNLEEFIAGLPESVAEPDVISDPTNGLVLIQIRDPDGNIVQVMRLIDE